MPKKKFVVREGFGYQHENKDFAAGETLMLEEEVGTAAHQLEAVGKAKVEPIAPPAAPEGGEGALV